VQGAGIDPHLREMIVAGIGIALVCAAAGLPLLAVAGASQLTVVQAGLMSSAVHLLGSMLVASAMFMRGLLATYPLLICWGVFCNDVDYLNHHHRPARAKGGGCGDSNGKKRFQTMLKFLAASSPLEHVVPHELHMKWGPFEMNNQMLMRWWRRC